MLFLRKIILLFSLEIAPKPQSAILSLLLKITRVDQSLEVTFKYCAELSCRGGVPPGMGPAEQAAVTPRPTPQSAEQPSLLTALREARG